MNKKSKFCPKCKGEVDKDAEKCKHCGSKLKTWPQKHPILTIFVAAILFYIVFNFETEKQNENKTPKQIIKISADQIFQEYQRNEISADEKYKNKIIEVSGIIDSVGKDILDTMYVALKTSDIFGSVQCMLDNSELGKAVNLQKGASIILSCEPKGKIVNVLLDGCVIK